MKGGGTPYNWAWRTLTTARREKATQGSGNAYNLRELAGAFGDLGTLIPFLIGYITISKLDPVGVLVALWPVQDHRGPLLQNANSNPTDESDWHRGHQPRWSPNGRRSAASGVRSSGCCSRSPCAWRGRSRGICRGRSWPALPLVLSVLQVDLLWVVLIGTALSVVGF